MPITNVRTYDAQAMTASGVSLGGLARITEVQGYTAVTRSRYDGRQGTASILRKDKFVRGTLSCSDVTKCIALITAGPADADDYLIYYTAKDGTSPTAYIKHKLLRPRYTGLSVRIPAPGDVGSFEVTFECLWIKESGTDAAVNFDDVHGTTDNVVEATVEADRTNPEILAEVIAAAHASKSIEHRSAFNFRIDGPVLRDRNPGYNGPDSIIWKPDTLRFDLATKDTGVSGTPLKTTMQELLDAAAGDLAVTVGKVNGSNDKLFTLKNAKFIEDPEEYPFDNYSGFSPNGESEWVDSDGTTHRTLSGANPILTIANA